MRNLFVLFLVGSSLVAGYQIGYHKADKDRDFETRVLLADAERFRDPIAWKSAEKVSKLTGVSLYQVMTGLKP